MGSIAPPMQPLEIAIVGGGIAGLTLAIGLLRRGLHVKIYERGRSFREIGAGIGFTQNAEWAMKVLDPEIHQAFKRVTVQNGTDWFMWMDGEHYDEAAEDVHKREKLIHKLHLGERGFEGCHRADFLDQLIRLLPADCVGFGRNLADIADDPVNDRVRLNFTDGSFAEANAVIGCDGIRSRVKQLILGEVKPESHPSYTHKYAFRGLVPMEKAKAVLGNEKTETRHMYLGPDGHALTFPVAGGKLLNVVAFTTDPEEWPYPDKFTMPADKSDAVKAFARFNPIVRSIIDLLPDQLDKWAVFDTFDHPPSTYFSGRICLAGDSAHAAAPYHGAGAGFAIEDSAVLAHQLAAVQGLVTTTQVDSSALLRATFRAYNKVRLARAQWLVDTSRFVGRMYEWQDPVVGNDLEKVAQEIDWRSKRIWYYDIDDMVKEAQQALDAEVKDLTLRKDYAEAFGSG